MRMPILTGEPLAIIESGLNSIIQVDFKTTLEKYQAVLARPGEDVPGANLTTTRGRTAIVEMIGPIFHYSNILSMVFGFPSCEQILQDIAAAQNNPAIDKIILHIDSPGGQVGGLSDLTAFIQGRVTKPVTAYVGDMCASAAYWVASAADTIIAAPTAEIGSIGVVLSVRRRDDDSIEIVSSASPKKRPDPATDAGRAVLQVRADAIADVFVSQVSKNRGLTTGHIEATEGNVFIAQTALEMGLIDGIGSLEGVLNGAVEKATTKLPIPKAGFMDLVSAYQAEHGCKKSVAMGAIAAKNPHLYQAWLLDQQTGHTKHETPAPSRLCGVDFMQLVNAHQAEHGCKKSVAIGVVAAAQPDVHRAWLLDQQRRS